MFNTICGILSMLTVFATFGMAIWYDEKTNGHPAGFVFIGLIGGAISTSFIWLTGTY